jgi:hypothetical protein
MRTFQYDQMYKDIRVNGGKISFVFSDGIKLCNNKIVEPMQDKPVGFSRWIYDGINIDVNIKRPFSEILNIVLKAKGVNFDETTNTQKKDQFPGCIWPPQEYNFLKDPRKKNEYLLEKQYYAELQILPIMQNRRCDYRLCWRFQVDCMRINRVIFADAESGEIIKEIRGSVKSADVQVEIKGDFARAKRNGNYSFDFFDTQIIPHLQIKLTQCWDANCPDISQISQISQKTIFPGVITGKETDYLSIWYAYHGCRILVNDPDLYNEFKVKACVYSLSRGYTDMANMWSVSYTLGATTYLSTSAYITAVDIANRMDSEYGLVWFNVADYDKDDYENYMEINTKIDGLSHGGECKGATINLGLGQGDMPYTVCHEYSHGCVWRAFGERFVSEYENDYEGLACDEALADYFSADFIGTPKVSDSRDISSFKTYSSYVGAENNEYENALILSSALWELRGKLTSDKRLGYLIAMAIEVMKNNNIDKVTFADLATYVIESDDRASGGDNNPSNLTPNYAIICKVFAEHGIDNKYKSCIDPGCIKLDNMARKMPQKSFVKKPY